LSLRALALNSNIDKAGVSSKNNFTLDNLFIASFKVIHSVSSNSPFLILSLDICVWADNILITNCGAVISKEKNAMGKPNSTAIFRAIDRAKAVFPIPGLAAIIIKSDGCNPPVS